MAETHIVFNDQLSLYGQQYITREADLPNDQDQSEYFQKRKILALLFEQFLLFDRIAVKIDRQCTELYFLIKELGINKIEELLDRGILIPVLWTPVIVTSLGQQLPDGSFDESTIIGQSPIVAGSLADDESNPEKNIDRLLSYFNLHPDRKRIFKKRVRDKYVLPNNAIANQATDIVIDAYLKGRLSDLGLKNDKDPTELSRDERWKLFTLGHNILETSVLAEKRYKSYDKYQTLNLTQASVRSIESAYHVSENTSQILKVENLANIQSYVLDNKIPFDRVFDLRYKPNIKHYRKWINSISETTDALSVTKDYIDEVAGKNKFFDSSGGKFIRTVGMFGVGTGIGSLVAGPPGAAIGALLGKATDLGLALLDTYVLDGILKGWNPRMFVDEIKIEASEPAKLED